MIKKISILVLISPFALYAGLCYLIYSGQREMIYFPAPETATSLADELSLMSDGEELKIWHHAGRSGRAILYFGGNAENVAGNVGNFRTVFPDHSLYFMNYRGYGGSSGEPSEVAFFTDAVALFDLASETHTEVSVIGRSLGSGVATHLAAERDVERLVLVTPFDSIENVIKDRYFIFPISMLLTEKYDSVGRIAEIDSKVLVILAEEDEVVSYTRSLALVSAFPEGQNETIILSGVGHNSIDLSSEYLMSLWNFLAR